MINNNIIYKKWTPIWVKVTYYLGIIALTALLLYRYIIIIENMSHNVIM